MITTALLSVLAAAPVDCESKGLDACRAACKAKQGAACVSLGNLLRETPAAKKEMLAAYETACTLKLALGCSKLGTALLRDATGVADQRRAADLFRLACDANDGLGCSNLAALVEDGIGVARDVPASTRLYVKACRLKDGFACGMAGLAYLYGTGVAVDEARGNSLCEQGCSLGSTSACVSLASLDRLGRAGHPRDPAKAAKVFIPACEGDDPMACASLADMYGTGEGVPRDAARARTLRAHACELGVTDSCDSGKAERPAMGN